MCVFIAIIPFRASNYSDDEKWSFYEKPPHLYQFQCIQLLTFSPKLLSAMGNSVFFSVVAAIVYVSFMLHVVLNPLTV